jgi:hypothetical protein
MLRSLPFRWQPDTVTQERVFQAMGIRIENLAYDRRLVFDQLAKVRGLTIRYSPDLEELSFPVLEEIVADAGLYIWRNEKLAKISFPKLRLLSPEATTAVFQIAWCPALTTITFPEIVTWGGQSYDFSGNALSAETVNHILARMVADEAFEYRVIDLNGGTRLDMRQQGVPRGRITHVCPGQVLLAPTSNTSGKGCIR